MRFELEDHSAVEEGVRAVEGVGVGYCEADNAKRGGRGSEGIRRNRKRNESLEWGFEELCCEIDG